MGAATDRWPPPRFYRHALLALGFLIASASAFVSAILLYTYCIPGPVATGASGCVFPHWLAADFFLGGAVLFLVLGLLFGGWALYALEPERYRDLFPYDYGPGARPKTPAPSTPEAARPPGSP